MANVLITAINYWPERSGNAPYTSALAEHLVGRGHSVTVLTGMPHYPAWRVDARYASAARVTERIRGVRVIRRRHTVPGHQSVAGRGLYEATFLFHGLATGVPRPDAVVGVIPSLSGGFLARVFAARYHVRYGVIVQDLMGHAAAQSGMPAGGGVAQAVAGVEAGVLRHASLVAAVSTSFFPALRELGVCESRLVHLPNWTVRPPVSVDRAKTRRSFGWGREQVVLHAGNMGLKQGLEQVIDAARFAVGGSPAIRFVLLGDGNQRERLEQAARGLPNVQFLPSQPDDRYAAALAAADVLLLSERATVVDMSLPGKITAYCAAGRPIVAAVRPFGATAGEVERSGAGLLVPAGSPELLLAALERLRSDRDLAARLGAAGEGYAAACLDPASGLGRSQAFVERLLT